MNAKQTQQYIVDIAFNKKEIPANNKGLQAYRFLVEYRFFEVLSNAFPIFYSMVDQKRFEQAVIAFMQSGAKSNEMWRVPDEFRLFVKEQEFFQQTMPFVHDLLWFEWIEVALMMGTYGPKEQSIFSWDKEYTLSKSAVLKVLDYPVYEQKNFENRGEYHLLAYYDFDAKQVYFREIGPPLYLFLSALETKGIQGALEEICHLSEEQPKNVQSFFQYSLEELLFLKVIEEQ